MSWSAITSVITALTAVGALVFTGLSLSATRESQYTDRFIKAVEQLDKAGAEHLQGRLGGIYALERLARDSPRDQPTVIEVLSAFIRTSAPAPRPRSATENHDDGCPERPASDIQAALTILGRREPKNDNNAKIDLRATCLGKADLSHSNFKGANFVDVSLHGAQLNDSTFVGTNFLHANLDGVNLTHADLTEANLHSAWLWSARLDHTTLNKATLAHSFLDSAYIYGARIIDAHLGNAELHHARVIDSNLTGTDLTISKLFGTEIRTSDLSGADLTDAKYDDTTTIDQVRTDSKTKGKWWW